MNNLTRIYLAFSPSSITDDALAQAIEQLPTWRREQCLRIKHRQGCVECAIAYQMLRRAMLEAYGIAAQPDFIIGEHGKPSLKQFPNIHFNISHCKQAIAVAVSDAPIGIDIEVVGRYTETVAAYAMSEAEHQSILTATSPQLQFAMLWTKKEAVAKLTGNGITDSIKTLLATTTAHIHTYHYPESNCVLSVAQPHESNPVVCVRHIPE